MRSKPQNKMAKPRPKILDQQNQPQNDDKENNSVKTPQSRKIKGSTQATKTTTIETSKLDATPSKPFPFLMNQQIAVILF